MIQAGVIAEVANHAAAATGNPYPQVNTILLTGLITLALGILRFIYNNRTLTTKVNGEIRAEFIQEMERLRDEVRGSREENAQLRDEVRSSRDEVRGLRDENAKLRDEVRGLNDIITGMSRQQAGANTSAQRMIADAIAEAMPHSPQIDRMLGSLGSVEGDKKV